MRKTATFCAGALPRLGRNRLNIQAYEAVEAGAAEAAGRADLAGERTGAGVLRRIATATKTTPAAAT